MLTGHELRAVHRWQNTAIQVIMHGATRLRFKGGYIGLVKRKAAFSGLRFGYISLESRVSTTVNNSTRAFGRDGIYVTDPVLTHGTDTSFTPGISERRSGTTTFLHSGLKSADAQSSTAQAITATRTYDAFGMIRSSTGTWRGPFGYAGAFGYQEDASGLRLLGHRYYDASTGRFLTRDPIKDGRNWYAYVNSNTLGYIDPDGLVPLPLIYFGVKAVIIGIGGYYAGKGIADQYENFQARTVAKQTAENINELCEVHNQIGNEVCYRNRGQGAVSAAAPALELAFDNLYSYPKIGGYRGAPWPDAGKVEPSPEAVSTVETILDTWKDPWK